MLHRGLLQNSILSQELFPDPFLPVGAADRLGLTGWALPNNINQGQSTSPANQQFEDGFHEGIAKSAPAGFAICGAGLMGAGYLGAAAATAFESAAVTAGFAALTGSIKNGIKEYKKPDGSFSRVCRNTVADTAGGFGAGLFLGPFGKPVSAAVGAVIGGIMGE
jgi:hypothetical protein